MVRLFTAWWWLDIRNAFNTADWARTLESLRAFKIPGYLLQDVRSYFRKFEDVDGVPQGSVLGPLL